MWISLQIVELAGAVIFGNELPIVAAYHADAASQCDWIALPRQSVIRRIGEDPAFQSLAQQAGFIIGLARHAVLADGVRADGRALAAVAQEWQQVRALRLRRARHSGRGREGRHQINVRGEAVVAAPAVDSAWPTRDEGYARQGIVERGALGDHVVVAKIIAMIARED